MATSNCCARAAGSGFEFAVGAGDVVGGTTNGFVAVVGTILRAVAALSDAGDELFPLYVRALERKMASTTLSLSRTTMSFMPTVRCIPLL